MIKIWTKLYKNNILIKNYMFELPERFNINDLSEYISEICYTLDIPHPLILKKHIHSLDNFNTVKFLPDEFIEKVDFDKMVLENYSF